MIATWGSGPRYYNNFTPHTNLLKTAAKELENLNKYRQYRRIVNRDTIVLMPHCWSGGPLVSLQTQGAYDDRGKRWVCDLTKPVILKFFGNEIATIDPVQQTATLGHIWNGMDWRINQWLPIHLWWEKFNRHTPGQHLIRGNNGTFLVAKGVRIDAEGNITNAQPPITVKPTKDWVPYIRHMLKTLRQRVEPFEPWRMACDREHNIFGMEALRQRQADIPFEVRLDNIIGWIEEGDDYADVMGAYTDVITFGPHYWQQRPFRELEHMFKRALLVRKCSTVLS
jgi:hypothetical protein